MTGIKKLYWITLAKAAGIRALRSFLQSMVVLMGFNGGANVASAEAVTLWEFDWIYILGASAAYALVSAISAVATGLPEVDMTLGIAKAEGGEDDTDSELRP